MGFLADSLGVITEAVLGAEPQMDRAGVVELVERAVRTRPQQRRLAQALMEAPDLLVSGRPEGPVVVQTLIGALLAAGARHVVALRCARCGLQRHLDCRHEGRWICGSCRQALIPQPGCERCGRSAGDVGGAGGGCPGCDPQAALEEVQVVVTALDPQLPTDAVAEAVVAVCRTVRKRGELARDLRADPGLLTGGGARGSAQLVRFIDALLARGARAVVRPTCPGCGREGVYAPLNGVRVCRSCLSRERREPCGRCGKERPVGSRDAGGTAVCRPCNRADPANHEECSGCGRLALIVRRVQHGGLCARCHRVPTAVCSACGRTRPCLYATTDQPRCEPCNDLLRKTVACSTCGRERRVEARGPDGQPVCANCARAHQHQPCSQCGYRRRVGHRTADGAVLCRTCFANHPNSRHPCRRCAEVARLHHRGLCPSCALADLLDRLLAGPDGTVPSRLDPVVACLMRGEHAPMLRWLETHPGPRTVLKALAASGEPVTHQFLDGLRPTATVAYLRAALVVDGVLPPRDEQLAALERRLPRELAHLEVAADRQAVRSFATWHHFKRLRRLPPAAPTTYYQALNVRRDIQAATALARWLRDRGTSLADATQHDIDAWLASSHHLRCVASTFVSWAVAHRYAHGIAISRTSGDGPMPVIGHDRRWTLVRHLLHDVDLPAATRVAGLLLLLYAQPVSRTAGLRLEQIIRTGDTVYLALGPVPTPLPDPLAQLVLTLAGRRHGHGTLGRTPDHPWLIPGLSAGEPISASRLTISLNKLGIRARPARNTTLIELTADLPPVVLARLLGLNINSAERWSADAAASRATYATVLARRPDPRP